MNRLLTVFFLTSFVSTFVSAQGIGEAPIITINSTSVVEGIDPWNGELCLFTGNPSLGSISFDVTDTEDMPIDLTIAATSSNPLVVPVNVQNLRISYDFDTGQGVLFINPIDEGQATIILTATDSDWNKTSYYIDLTVKGCTNILRIRQSNLSVLPVNQDFTFQASVRILTLTGNIAPMIGSNQDIEFLAGNSVSLNAGFEVKPGGEFLADIEDCN